MYNIPTSGRAQGISQPANVDPKPNGADPIQSGDHNGDQFYARNEP